MEILEARHPDDTFVMVYSLREARKAVFDEKFDVLVVDIMWTHADEEAIPRSSEQGGLIAGLLLIDLIEKLDRLTIIPLVIGDDSLVKFLFKRVVFFKRSNFTNIY